MTENRRDDFWIRVRDDIGIPVSSEHSVNTEAYDRISILPFDTSHKIVRFHSCACGAGFHCFPLQVALAVDDLRYLPTSMQVCRSGITTSSGQNSGALLTTGSYSVN